MLHSILPAFSPLALIPATAPTLQAATESGHSILGSALGLVLGIVQLIVGLSIAAFCINNGFALVSRMLEGINLWAEIKKKNIAVALLAGGVVISYTNVIGSGIESMTKGLQTVLTGQGFGPGISALLGGALNLIIAIAVASFAITVTFKVMDKLTGDIDEKEEFRNGNTAIGIVYAGILIGVSSLISAGVSGIGSGVTAFLSSIIH